jgi:hypothetical protein
MPTLKSAAMRSRPDGRNDRRSAGEGMGQTAVVISIGAILVVTGLFATGEYVTTQRREPTLAVTAPGAAVPGGTAAAGMAAVDAVIYKGSILFMPEFGNTCRQLFFNNRTGRLNDNGNVNCLAALAEAGFEQPQQPSATLRVISDGFRQR